MSTGAVSTAEHVHVLRWRDLPSRDGRTLRRPSRRYWSECRHPDCPWTSPPVQHKRTAIDHGVGHEEAIAEEYRTPVPA